MWKERKSKSPFPLFPHCLRKARKNRDIPTFHSFGDDLDFHFLQVRLTSTSTKSVTYMPGTFCYRHARSHSTHEGFRACVRTALMKSSPVRDG